MADIIPHSAEWFEAVQKHDPVFARTARVTTECDGSVRVCSVCGDEPVGAFRIIEAVASTRGIPTIRLCDCRLEIREGFGEALVLMKPEPFIPIKDLR